MQVMRVLVALAVASAIARQTPVRQPLDVARTLASKYPASPIMSYIPGVAWTSALRLAALTGEAQWNEKPRRDMQPFIAGEKAAIASMARGGRRGWRVND